MSQMRTIKEMVENKMIRFKKNGQIDKRCSAFKQKIVDENCNLNPPKGSDENCNLNPPKGSDENIQKVDDLSESLAKLMVSESYKGPDNKMVSTCCGWVFDVHNSIIFSETKSGSSVRETLSMTFDMIKLFLSSNKITNAKSLELLGIISWRISNKLLDDDFYLLNEEINTLCDYDYTDTELYDMEFKLMNYISYSVCREGINRKDFIEKYKDGIQKSLMAKKDILKMVGIF